MFQPDAKLTVARRIRMNMLVDAINQKLVSITRRSVHFNHLSVLTLFDPSVKQQLGPVQVWSSSTTIQSLGILGVGSASLE